MARLFSSRLFKRGNLRSGAALCAMRCCFTPLSSQCRPEGLRLCGNVIVPSLFPFFRTVQFCVEVGLIRHLGRLLEPLMRPLFRVSGACASAFVLGIIGGYPVGQGPRCPSMRRGYISEDEAERLLAFCNNCGPAFILASSAQRLCQQQDRTAALSGPHSGLRMVGILSASEAVTVLAFPK